MRTYEWVVAAYFAYLLVLAWVRPLPAVRRWHATISSTALLGLLSTAIVWDGLAPIRYWLPLVYVLAGYWLSGRFFVQPMTEIEARLAAGDGRLFAALNLPARLERAPGIVLEYLEAMYFAAPAFLAAGLMVLLGGRRADLVDRYWTIVILAEFGAFAALPWVQTRPPWAIESTGAMDRRQLTWRGINRRISLPLQTRVNTFPSGHASGTLAVALAVIPAAPVPGVLLLILALSVSAAAVTGRYHYGLDVVAGIGVAVLALWLGTLLT